MTLQDLIEELEGLPVSARTAMIVVRQGDYNQFDVESVRYDSGVVAIGCSEKDMNADDDAPLS